MNRKAIVQIIALLCSGLMAGLLFGDWLGPSFARARMSASSFIEFQQIVHYNYLVTLPALSFLAVIAPVVWLVLWRSRRRAPEFWILLVATVLIIIGQAITFLVNVPVNDVLETWNPAAPPSDARQVWARWETAHVVRTVVWVAGFLLETVALALSARPSSENARYV